MVNGVAAEYRLLSAFIELDDDMATRVSRRRLYQHRIVDGVRAINQFRLAGLNHGNYAVAIGIAALRVAIRLWILARIAPFVLRAREQVFCVRKGRNPASI